MARPVWRGSINFGLVSIPVALYRATEDHAIHFHQLERDTADRIRYQRINERTGKEVDYQDIVKGREVGGGKYITVEPAELDDIAPGRSQTLDIEAFVDLAEIDPIHFGKTYWLGPASEDSEQAYRLLVAAMAHTNRAGIALFVLRGRQYLTAVRADRDVLALETLYFADEIRDPGDVLDVDPGKAPEKGKQLDMAVSLIESMSAPWRPEDYHDTYTERVKELLADKQAGRTPKPARKPAEPTEVADLLDVLRRSVRAAKRKGTADVADMSKKQLSALAKELDIKGRSTMNADELRKAVKRAA